MGPSPSSTRTSQQHRISANLLARRDASPNLLALLVWCCSSQRSILDNSIPALLLFLLLFSLTTTATAPCFSCCLLARLLASCCWVESIAAPQTVEKSNIASAHLQAHLRHLPHTSATVRITPARPRHLFLVVAAALPPTAPTTSSIGLPAFTCCARLDHSSASILLLLLLQAHPSPVQRRSVSDADFLYLSVSRHPPHRVNALANPTCICHTTSSMTTPR